jgi:hypothetical protein
VWISLEWHGGLLPRLAVSLLPQGSGREILLDGEIEDEKLLSGVGEVISMEVVNSSISATQHNTCRPLIPKLLSYTISRTFALK